MTVAEAETDLIDQLSNMSDAELLKRVGLADKLEGFKQDLERAKALSGRPRARINEAIDKAINPKPASYIVEDLSWQVERAEERQVKDATDFINSQDIRDPL